MFQASINLLKISRWEILLMRPNAKNLTQSTIFESQQPLPFFLSWFSIFLIFR